MRILSTEEQSSLEKYLCADMDEIKLGIYLCLYTGLRIGEAYVKLKLNTCDVTVFIGYTLDTTCSIICEAVAVT